jgi:hypothetical protein
VQAAVDTHDQSPRAGNNVQVRGDDRRMPPLPTAFARRSADGERALFDGYDVDFGVDDTYRAEVHDVPSGRSWAAAQRGERHVAFYRADRPRAFATLPVAGARTIAFAPAGDRAAVRPLSWLPISRTVAEPGASGAPRVATSERLSQRYAAASMPRLLGCLAVLAAACGASPPAKPSAPPAAAPTGASASTDALWRLAPALADQAVVVSGDGLEAVITTLGLARASSADLAAQLDSALAGLPLPLWDRAAIARAGIDPRGGLAAFSREGSDTLWIVGVSDEAAFRAAIGTRLGVHCRNLDGFMACADYLPLLLGARRGGATLAATAAAMPPELRGNVEIVYAPEGIDIARGALRVSRGVVEGRFFLTEAGGLFTATERSPLLASLERAGVGGAMSIDLRSSFAPGGFMHEVVGDLAGALRGDALMTAAAGEPARGVLRAPVVDRAKAKELLARCAMLSLVSSTFSATPRDGGCDVTVGIPGSARMTTHLRMVGDELRADVGPATPAVTSPPPARLVALLAEPWALAAWGRFDMATDSPLRQVLASQLLGATHALLVHLDELGAAQRSTADGTDLWFTVGTLWRNDDAVLAELQPLLARAAWKPLAADLRAIAARFPTSPLAEDLRAGYAPGLPAAAAVGMVAGFWVPKFQRLQAMLAEEHPAPKGQARRVVHRLTFQAFPRWAAQNSGKGCPSSLAELSAFAAGAATADPWGKPYELICVAGDPEVGVYSRGPDGAVDTDDDVNSWD